MSLWYRLKWRAGQNRPAAALVLMLLASLITFAGYGVYSRIQAQREAEVLRELAQDSNEVSGCCAQRINCLSTTSRANRAWSGSGSPACSEDSRGAQAALWSASLCHRSRPPGAARV